MTIQQEVAAREEELIALRRWFHTHPEASCEEYHTAERIERELDSVGIEHRRVGETGVYGVIYGGQPGGGVIALRADIDALKIQDEKTEPYRSQTDGVMHACGHDAHTASLVEAAKILQSRRGGFAGQVRLFFQQGEEVGYGARVFLNEGLLDGAGRVFGVHMASEVPVGVVGVKAGPNNASVDHFTIRIHGAAAHVSTPQRGVDALYIASQLVVALQAVVTRRISPIDTVIIGIGVLRAGDTYNSVAKEAVLEGTVRVFTPELRAFVHEQVSNMAVQTAALYGGTADSEWEDYTSPLSNDPAVCGEVSELVRAYWGDKALMTDRPLSLGGDDFAEYLLRVPGVYAYVGSGSEKNPNTTMPHHCGLFDIDERALGVAASLYAGYAERWLQSQK